MPRDSPANTPYAFKIIDSLKSVFKKLPDTIAYKSIFKKYCEYILNQRSAIYHATKLLPILAALIVIVVERDLHHASELTKMRNQHAQELNKIREEMDQLRRDFQRLTFHD
jgi:hypothetical protein